MKYSPQNNAQTLGLHEPAVRLTGTRRQKADHLMTMFNEAEIRVKREEHDSGDREAFRLKG